MKNKLEWEIIIPRKSEFFEEEVKECLSRIRTYRDSSENTIIHLSFFINASNNSDYTLYSSSISHQLGNIFADLPSTSIIAQPPADGNLLVAEVVALSEQPDDMKINFKELEGIHYVILEDDSTQQLFAGGIHDGNKDHKFIDQVSRSYSILEKILTNEGFTFGDIVRQWNFVESIFSVHEIKGESIQNYQVLNDIRTSYYAKSVFPNSYPAATAIGMNSGGLILEIYAVKSKRKIDIIPLKNPKQTDAYHYSENVLIGKSLHNYVKKTTPKFERAKYINLYGKGTVFISGTAAVVEEKTVGIGNTSLQAKTTIENIELLISEKNLEQAGINSTKKLKYAYIRVYIKNAEDAATIIDFCDKYFLNVPIQYLVADVCRDNLLLEIEGVAQLI